MRKWGGFMVRETLIKSLSDFILGFFMQSKESSDANSELFKEDDDEAMYKNPYEIRLCDLISVSLAHWACRPLISCERGSAGSVGSTGSKGSVRRIKIRSAASFRKQQGLGVTGD